MFKVIGVLVACGTMMCTAMSVKEMKAEVHKKGEESLPFRWAKVGDSPKPALVLFLHGAGERGSNNEGQLKHGVPDLLKWLTKSKESAVVVAPQCRKGIWWENLKGDYRAPNAGDLAEKPSAMISLVFEVVDRLIKENQVDPNRVYVTGLSMGGFGTFAAVARRPKLFAAAMPVCGGGDPATAKLMKKVPFWVFHGDADTVVPLSTSIMMVEALKKEGAEVKFSQYKGVRHDSWTQTYGNAAVWKWLFEQRKE